MRRDLKAEIIAAAREMFNARGYNSVSMRDIAESLGISVGNLTYHYKKKEDILEAIVLEMHRNYRKPVTPRSIQELNRYLDRLLDVYHRNAYYFAHYTQFSQLRPSIRAIQEEAVANQFALLEEAFLLLNRSGLLQGEWFPGHYRHLARSLLMICIYWISQSKLEQGMDSRQDFFCCVWGVLLPMLTEEGKTVCCQEIFFLGCGSGSGDSDLAGTGIVRE